MWPSRGGWLSKRMQGGRIEDVTGAVGIRGRGEKAGRANEVEKERASPRMKEKAKQTKE